MDVWPESLGGMLEYWYIERGLLTEISRSFPRLVYIVAWPVQRWFAQRGKFQKLFSDRREIKSKLVHSTSFPRNQNNSVEIPYIITTI